MPTDVLINLPKAEIFELNEKGEKVEDRIVKCVFNPAEYTISKSNSYAETPEIQANAPKVDFKTVNSRQLSLSLIFDTYESGQDVNEKTKMLWEFMRPREHRTEENKSTWKPPEVAFEWGVFRFRASITSISQQFTLFTHEGVPVRAKLNVTFKEYVDPQNYNKASTNPTSGGGLAERLWQVVAGDRLDNIAARVYHDASKWRIIAEYNHLRNPLALPPGMLLRIPMD
jgi:hypothetical protein